MEKFLGVVFDLDDTLYAEKEFVRSGFQAVSLSVAERYGISKDEVERTLNTLFDEGVRGKTFTIAFERFRLPAEDVPWAVALYRTHHPEIHLFDEAKEILEYCRAIPGLKIGLVTDGFAPAQRNKIAALGVEHFFDSVIITDEWGEEFRKPHARAFEETIARFGISPATIIYVGDNKEKDFAGAKEAGMKTVCVRRQGGVHAHKLASQGGEPDYEWESVLRLKSYV